MATKYDVKISISASNDLDEIYSYISETLYADDAAKKLMREIEKSILSLSEFPHRFSASLDVSLAQRGYRRIVVKNYVILFTVDESTHTVYVARIFHGKMNYSKYV